MDEDTLTIYLKLVTTQADQADAAQHQRFRQRIKETSSFEAGVRKADADAKKQADKERSVEIEANLKRETERRLQQQKGFLDAERKANKERVASTIAANKEREASDAAYVRAKMVEAKALAQIERDRVKSFKAYDADIVQYRKEVGRETLAEARKNLAAQSDDVKEYQRTTQTRNRLMHEDGIGWAKRKTAETKRERMDELSALLAADKQTIASSRSVHEQEKRRIDDLKSGSKEASSAIMGVAMAYTTMRIAAEAGQAAHAVLQAMGQSLREVRDHVKEIVADMEQARDRLTEIMVMRGQPATGMGAAQISAEAMQAHTTSEKYEQFLGTWQTETQGRVGPEGDITAGSQKGLGIWAAHLTTSQGIDPEVGARLAISASKIAKKDASGQMDETDFKDKFAKLTEVAQLSPGRTKTIASATAKYLMRSVGEGRQFAPEEALEAAHRIRVMADLGVENPDVFAGAVDKGLRQIRADAGKASDLGITAKMTPEQALQQAITEIPKIAERTGERKDVVTQKYFNEIREQAGFQQLETYGKGVTERSRKQIAGVTGETADAKMAASDAGQKAQADTAKAETEMLKRRNADAYAATELRRRKAYNRLLGKHAFEDREGLYDQMVGRSMESLGHGNREERMVGEEMIELMIADAKQTKKGIKALEPFYPKLLPGQSRERSEGFANFFGLKTGLQNRLEKAGPAEIAELESKISAALKEQTAIMKNPNAVPPMMIPAQAPNGQERH